MPNPTLPRFGAQSPAHRKRIACEESANKRSQLLSAALLNLHRNGIANGWRSDDYRAVAACLILSGRPTGRRWLSLAAGVVL
jgi:hypothetical protein